MSASFTTTRTAVVSATDARVEAVLRQLHADLLNAIAAKLTSHDVVCGWRDDLAYMLRHNAIVHFEIRVECGGRPWTSWRYEVSNDGSLRETSRGGGINFFGAPPGSRARLVIQRRPWLPTEVGAEIDRRGWTHPVPALVGSGERERAYSQDGWGVVRLRYAG